MVDFHGWDMPINYGSQIESIISRDKVIGVTVYLTDNS